MKINLVCIGKIKDKNMLAIANDYQKRIGYFADFTLIELKESNQNKSILEYKEKHSGDLFYLLDENGTEFNSIQFSKEIKNCDKQIHFLIANANGFSKDTKSKFKNKLSLSQMTFPHELARVLLLEQLYRAFMIINNRNYHKQ